MSGDPMPEAVNNEVADMDIFPTPTVLAVYYCYFSSIPLCWLCFTPCMALLCRLSSSALYSPVSAANVAYTIGALDLQSHCDD